VGRALFDLIRSEATISTMLSAVYAEPRAVGQELPRRIRQVTDATDGGHAAFASILWSPPASIGGGGSFDDLLRQVRCPALLLYGQEDPWITPAFGRTAYRALAARGGGGGDAAAAAAAAGAAVVPAQQLIFLSPCGHCPQHEAPAATAALAARWLNGEAALLGEGSSGPGTGAGAGSGGEAAAAAAAGEAFTEDFGTVRARRVSEVELGLAPWERLMTWALR
jgi:pimeloyl-ACP methyl ester carboxylesterase